MANQPLTPPSSDTIASLLATDPSKVHLEKLHGDASNRIYYRVKSPKGSCILMQRPIAGPESASEEITSATSKPTEYPFLSIHRYLSAEGLPVPNILGQSAATDLILLEDLGDQTFEKAYLANPDQLQSLYRDALSLLVRFQSLKSPANGGKSCIAWERRFDAELLTWEFEHFIEWGLERGVIAKVSQADLSEMRRIFRDLVAEIEEFPTGLTHRDFQSRNLMRRDGKLILLDFQDALVAPRIYDVVALLRDSYIELPEKDLVSLLHFYGECSGFEDARVQRMFNVQTVQRKLKDGGRFHYIHLFKGNPNFLPHVPASYRYVARALSLIPEGKHLQPILAKHLPEFQR